MASIVNVAVDRFQQAYWKFRIAYDEATLDPTSYWNAVAQEVSSSLAEAQISTLVEIDSQSWAHPAPDLPQWARDLRSAGLKIALLSNMPTPVRQYIERCNWLPQFHYRSFSCNLSVAKPAPEIYRDAINGLAVDPAGILFLDDRPENVHAAEALGLHGIVYTTADRATQEICQRFDIPVPLVATVEYGNAQD